MIFIKLRLNKIDKEFSELRFNKHYICYYEQFQSKVPDPDVSAVGSDFFSCLRFIPVAKRDEGDL
jgi:hypothetical protein